VRRLLEVQPQLVRPEHLCARRQCRWRLLLAAPIDDQRGAVMAEGEQVFWQPPRSAVGGANQPERQQLGAVQPECAELSSVRQRDAEERCGQRGVYCAREFVALRYRILARAGAEFEPCHTALLLEGI